MERNIANRTLALAALFGCVGEVDRLARHAQADHDFLETMIRSILKLSADSVDDIYGGAQALRPGLQWLLRELGESAQPRDAQLMRYAVSVIDLERRLHKNRAVADRLAAGIEDAQRQSDYFEPAHDNVIAALAALYRDTIGQLGPRVIVRGEPHHLADERIASRIRVLLLAAIRAAVLWRQAGGNRWRLLLERRAMAAEAARLT